MAVTTDTIPDTRNLIARLWSNREARSVIIQIVTMVVLCAVLALIVRNVVVNLAAIGKDFSFGFLFAPAAYDITFSPFIEYSSRSTHLRAAAVGILNTLLVAVCGIVLATVMGFTLGILRLSKNWLINRTVYCFLEFTRNVPVLLHILLIHGLVVTQLPVPKRASNIFDLDIFFLTNRGFYVPSPVPESGFWIVATVFVISVGFVIGFRRWAKKVQEETGRIYPVFWISVGAIVGATAVAFLAAGMPISWDVPALKGFNFTGGLALKPEFLALWLALSYYTSSFIAEIVRSGILAVSHGQTEAAYALGLRPDRTLQLVVIPQALRVIVPPLISQYLNLTKNSSLAVAIAYPELFTVGRTMINQAGRAVPIFLLIMAAYLAMSLTWAAVGNLYNRRVQMVEH